MDILKDNIDFEYNKYLFLALIHKAKKFYAQKKLQPILRDLYKQFEQLTSLKEKLDLVSNALPSELISMDLQKMELIREVEDAEESYIDDLRTFLDFAIPKLSNSLNEGKSLYDLFKEEMHLFPIGIEPIYNKEGYLLLRNTSSSNVYVFRYALNILESLQKNQASFRTEVIDVVEVFNRVDSTYESIKYKLTKNHKTDLPVPATYVVESDLMIPTYPTFLPIAQDVLAHYILTP